MNQLIKKQFSLFILIIVSIFFVFSGFTCEKLSDKANPDKSERQNPKKEPVQKEEKSFLEPAKNLFAKEGKKIDRAKIRIEVLNGCGEKGIAKEVTTRLRALGYDVVNVGNAESFYYDVTIIIDRIGKIENAKDVAKALKTDNYIQQIDKNRILEVSVIIGKDYQKIFPELKEAQQL